jgi:hypothetical protein
MVTSLREFIPIKPDELINGPLAEWLLIILFCGLFMGISGAVLPKHLTEKRYGKLIIVFTGIILGVGLYKSQELYNFNLESFGFMAIWLVLLVMGFVIYGLTKMGVKKSTALALTYCVMFMSFFLLSPSLFDTILQSVPWLAIVFVILFVYLIGKMLFGIFGGKNPLKAAKKIEKMDFESADSVEMEKEAQEEKSEIKDVKKKTVPATKKDLKSILDIEKLLFDIIKIIKFKKQQLDNEDRKIISDDLKRIHQSQNLLTKSMKVIREHLNAYFQHHKKDLNAIQARLNKASSPVQRQILEEEIVYQKKMIEIISFMDKVELKVLDFCKTFNSLIYKGISLIAKKNPEEALIYLQTAFNNLKNMTSIFQQQKKYEQYLIKLGKKTIKDLKIEKKSKHK